MRSQRLDLTDNERAFLITALRRLVDFNPQPLSPQIQVLKAILERLGRRSQNPYPILRAPGEPGALSVSRRRLSYRRAIARSEPHDCDLAEISDFLRSSIPSIRRSSMRVEQSATRQLDLYTAAPAQDELPDRQLSDCQCAHREHAERQCAYRCCAYGKRLPRVASQMVGPSSPPGPVQIPPPDPLRHRSSCAPAGLN